MSCVFRPVININGVEKDSILYDKLRKIFKKESHKAMVMWTLAKIVAEKNNNLEKDENGELTIEALGSLINLQDLKDDSEISDVVKELEGVLNKDGSPKEFKSINDATEQAEIINNRNSRMVASVKVNQNSNYEVELNQPTSKSEREDKVFVQRFNSVLNNKLLAFVENLGFKTEYITNKEYNGVFDPTNALLSSGRIKTVIGIAKGDIGEEAFTEEFAHFAIAGFVDTDLVKRLMTDLNDIETVKTVLGDEYNKYSMLYNNDFGKLRQEAAGKLLAMHLKGEYHPEALSRKSILRRIFNSIINVFRGTSNQDIDRLIDDAHQAAEVLSNKILTDEKVFNSFDTNKMASSYILYEVNKNKKELDKMKRVLDATKESISRHLNVYKKTYNTSLLNDRKSYKFIKTFIDNLDKNETAKSCIAFMNFINTQLSVDSPTSIFATSVKPLIQSISLYGEDEIDLKKLNKDAQTLRMIKDFINCYLPVLKQLKLVDTSFGLSSTQAEKISELAAKYEIILEKLKGNSIEDEHSMTALQADIMCRAIELHCGDNLFKDAKTQQEKRAQIALLIQQADKDSGALFDRWVNSVGEASDPMLSILHRMVKESHTKRDKRLFDISNKIRNIHAKYNLDTSFMYERDSNGKLTGRYISNINYEQYEKDYKAFIKSTYEDNTIQTDYQRIEAINKWKAQNTEEYIQDSGMMVPKHRNNGKYYKPLPSLSAEQAAFYNEMMGIKVELDMMYPSVSVSPFKAVQIYNEYLEGLKDNSDSIKSLWSFTKKQIHSKFLRMSDNPEYGNPNEIEINMSGEILNKLPIYFTQEIKDKSRLSTDFTGGLLAYAAGAINYDETNSIVNVLELTRDTINERLCLDYQGNSVVSYVTNILGRKEKTNVQKIGKDTVTGSIAKDFMESAVYGKHKKIEGSIGSDIFKKEGFVVRKVNKKNAARIVLKSDKTTTVNGVEYYVTQDDKLIKAEYYTKPTIENISRGLDTAESLDSLKAYTSLLGMGWNVFAGITNVVVGKIQMLVEIAGNENMTFKDAAIARYKYYKGILSALPETGLQKVRKTSKMELIANRMDATEDFYRHVMNDKIYQGTLGRIYGNTSAFVLNNIGEHYLHYGTMMAMMEHIKVVDKNNNEMSLYEAFSVLDEEGKPVELKLPDGLKVKDTGETVNDAYLDKLKLKIGRVNQTMYGAFNEDDKGMIHRDALGRLTLQFRQWMPAFYSRRFGGQYYDAIQDEYMEGYYRTGCRVLWKLFAEHKQGLSSITLKWNNLTNAEKSGFYKMLTESLVVVALAFLGAGVGPDTEKGNRASRMFALILKRTQIEVGAGSPIGLFLGKDGMFSNISTIVKSPFPAFKTLENMFKLLNYQDAFVTVNSGRYKGSSLWWKNFNKLIPYKTKLEQVVDISEEDYMFRVLEM